MDLVNQVISNQMSQQLQIESLQRQVSEGVQREARVRDIGDKKIWKLTQVVRTLYDYLEKMYVQVSLLEATPVVPKMPRKEVEEVLFDASLSTIDKPSQARYELYVKIKKHFNKDEFMDLILALDENEVDYPHESHHLNIHLMVNRYTTRGDQGVHRIINVLKRMRPYVNWPEESEFS